MKKYNITAICALVSSLLIGSSCLAMNNQPYNSISPLGHDDKIAWIQNGIDKENDILVKNVISNYAGYGTDGNLYYVYNQLSSTSNLIYMDYRILRKQVLSRILDNKTPLNVNLLKILKELTMREVTSIQPGTQNRLIGESLVNEVYKGIRSCQSQDKVRNVLSTILDSFSNRGERMIFIQNLLLNKAQAKNNQKTIENLFFAIEENILYLPEYLPNGENAINNFIDYKKPWFKNIVEAYVNSTLKFFHPERPYFFLKIYFPSILNNNLNQFLIETTNASANGVLFLAGNKPTSAQILCLAIENFKKNYNPEVANKILPEEILKSYVSYAEITSMQELSYISAHLVTMTNPETYIKALQIIYKNNLRLYIKLRDLWNSYWN